MLGTLLRGKCRPFLILIPSNNEECLKVASVPAERRAVHRLNDRISQSRTCFRTECSVQCDAVPIAHSRREDFSKQLCT